MSNKETGNWGKEVKWLVQVFTLNTFPASGFKLKSHGSKVYAQLLYAMLLSVPLLPHTHILSLNTLFGLFLSVVWESNLEAGPMAFYVWVPVWQTVKNVCWINKYISEGMVRSENTLWLIHLQMWRKLWHRQVSPQFLCQHTHVCFPPLGMMWN